MIFRQGIDIVENRRIDKIYFKYREKFLKKILTKYEIDDLKKKDSKKTFIRKVTSRFAAKEAAAKAIGTGFSLGLKFTDIEIYYDEYGKPELKIHNSVIQKSFGKKNKIIFNLTISNEKSYTIALVTLLSL